MSPSSLDLARSRWPQLVFDQNEPFFPVWIGVTTVQTPAESPSFRRTLVPPQGGRVIEYAVYYHWDIQHLYDLEHIWLFLDSQGLIVDAEASFHGRYLKGLLPGRDNLVSNELTLYVQPGKHALAPDPLVFRLLPDADEVGASLVGRAGAEVPRPLANRLVHSPEWDQPVERWLRGHGFRPSWVFTPWSPRPEQFVPWSWLDQRLPEFFLENLSLTGVS